MNWNYVKDKTPICYEEGEWDGLRSDEILCQDALGDNYVVRVYQGQMDGSEFLDWVQKDDFALSKIVKWAEIPD